MISSVAENIVKIKEGNNYPFQIKGIAELPDGTDYFVLIDPNQVKHLLEKKHYLQYHFEIGQFIECRIDKINCNGKIYIEPLHPFYQLGKEYEFPLIRMEKKNNQGDSKVAIFEDVFCNEIKLTANHFPHALKVGQSVKLKVVRIKKGLVYLSEPGFDEEYKGMTEGMEYSFIIKVFIDAPGKRNYYVIASPDGSMYKLRYKFYEKYGLAVGQTIYCRLIKVGKEIFLEPSHPYYQINTCYDFEIIGEDIVPDYPTGERKVCILRNDYGKKILVPVEERKPDPLKDGKMNCRVKDIRKGRIYLNCRK
jgi:hypothetical protein